MGSKNEQVRYWRGLSSSIPSSIISGRLLFEEDTGNVFFDYKDYNNGELKRVQLTDTSKINVNGGTFTGEVILFSNPEEDNEAVTKSYADGIQESINEHIKDKVVHITSTERSKWNNKVDSVSGKGLSTNDFTTALKNKLDGISDEATRVELQTEYNPTTSNQEDYYNLGTITIDGGEYTIYAPIPVNITGNAATASKLQNPVSIDGVMWDGEESDITHYALCNTSAGTKVKEITLHNFAFETGSLIYVNFRYGNNVEGAQLKLTTSDTSKTYDITYLGENIQSDQIYRGVYTFVYIGGSNPRFEMVASVDTKYGEATIDSLGLLSPEDKAKLDSIEENANNYELPIAQSGVLGGVMIGDNITYNSVGRISITQNNITEALGFQPLSEDSIDSDVIIGLLENFQGATNTNNGTYGLVPTPYAGDQDSLLRGDGNWYPISNIVNPESIKEMVEEVLDEFGIDPSVTPPEEGGGPVNPSQDMFVEPVDEPSGTAYAIWSEDNYSLNFYQREYKPSIGCIFNGLIVSNIFEFTGDGNDVYGIYVDSEGREPSQLYEIALNLKIISTIDKIHNIIHINLGAVNGDVYYSELTYINLINMNEPTNLNWFLNGYNTVVEVALPLHNNSVAVSSMHHAFDGCSELETIYVLDDFVSNFHISDMSIDEAFEGCVKLSGKSTGGIRYNTSKSSNLYAKVNGGYFTYISDKLES